MKRNIVKYSEYVHPAKKLRMIIRLLREEG